ncbi:MAG: RNA methyltransferase [Gemmatimonadales bacterium]|nr:MAG: RNA methyltransferase [Gemmatimonadales bacterium]
MNDTPATEPDRADRLDRVRIVLNEPQNLVNIAGVVRAMKNMGLSRLHVVNPAEWDAWRITGIAHRCDDLVEEARHFTTLEDAVADCVLVVGTSARARTAHRNYGYAADWGERLIDRAGVGPVALVFGREDRGLSNEELDRCDGVAIIPTAESYSSLNLAQACLLLAYEIRRASTGVLPPLPRGKRSTAPASRDQLELMFRALEGGLERIDFFSARRAENVMRTFRTLFARADLDEQEAGLVKALGFEIQRHLERVASGQIHLPNPGDPSDASPDASSVPPADPPSEH